MGEHRKWMVWLADESDADDITADSPQQAAERFAARIRTRWLRVRVRDGAIVRVFTVRQVERYEAEEDVEVSNAG